MARLPRLPLSPTPRSPALSRQGPVTARSSWTHLRHRGQQCPVYRHDQRGRRTGRTFQPGATRKSVLLAGQVTVPPGEQLVLVRGWDGTTADWAMATAESAATETEPNGSANTRLIAGLADWQRSPAAATIRAGRRLPVAEGDRDRAAVDDASHDGSAAAAGPGPAGRTGSGSRRSGTGVGPAAVAVRTAARPAQRRLVGRSHGQRSPCRWPPWSAMSVPGDNVLFTGSVGATPQSIELLAHVTGYQEEVTRTRAAPKMSPSTANPPAVMPHTRLQVSATGETPRRWSPRWPPPSWAA